jgi:hypothetical protein
MTAPEIVSLPQNVSCLSIQTRRSVTAEMDINPAWLDYGGGGGVSIYVIAQGFRIVAMKELFVESNLAGLSFDANCKEIVPVQSGRC